MKRICIFLFISILFVGCGKPQITDTELRAGKYLFNVNEMNSVEISGKDLLNNKEVNISTVEEDGRNIELVIKREEYGPAFAMDVFFGESGIDLVTYLEKSTDEWGGALEDFYYQLSCYDFDNDGEKEIIVGAGNKQNILELRILRLDYNNPDFGNAKILKSINSGCKAYVNEKGEICVMDSQGEILTYSLNN